MTILSVFLVKIFNSEEPSRLSFISYCKKTALPLLSLSALIYYFIVSGWGVIEIVSAIFGLLTLWLPIAVASYSFVDKYITDLISRIVFSAVVSYTLTTLTFFSFSFLHFVAGFYLSQVFFLVYGFYNLLKHREKVNLKVQLRSFFTPDWILITLIMLSLVLNLQYNNSYQTVQKDGSRVFNIFGDQTYFTSLAYELNRQVPPNQQSIQAGVPERAYHLFPHLTLVLIARFTGQSDYLRGNLVYHYTILEILLCLILYCIVKKITRSKWAGYIAITSLYILAIPNDALYFNPLQYFYFTIYPHVSSGLEPMILTSPQMYSGLVVVYGLLLGLIISLEGFLENKKVDKVLFLLGGLVVALLRFRVQIFLVVLPLFFCVLVWLWWQDRRKIYWFLGGVSLFLIGLLYLEMRSSNYLENTTKISLGYNGISSLDADSAWLNFWPLAPQVYNMVKSTILSPYFFNWAWQFISVLMFTLLNVVGMPLLMIIFVLFKRHSPRVALFLWPALSLTGFSILGGLFLKVSYDNYSVGGQMLLHTYWYLFPLTGLAIWHIYIYLKTKVILSRSYWALCAILIIIAGGYLGWRGHPTALQEQLNKTLTLSANEWNALQFIHNKTPSSAVIIANSEKYPQKTFAVYSGLAGRAAYFEYSFSYIKNLQTQIIAQEDRAQIIKTLWTTDSSEQFCKLLKSTVATYLVDYKDKPLRLTNPANCLTLIWTAGKDTAEVSIWQINR